MQINYEDMKLIVVMASIVQEAFEVSLAQNQTDNNKDFISKKSEEIVEFLTRIQESRKQEEAEAAKPFDGSVKSDVNLSVRERVAIRQALKDEVNIINCNRFIDESKKRNRMAICGKALEKVCISLRHDGVF